MRIFQDCEGAISAALKLLQSGKASEPGTISIFEKLRAQATSSKFQTPSSKEAPTSKTGLRAVCPGICLWGLVFEILNFYGAWGLGVGVSIGGGSKTEIRPGIGNRFPGQFQRAEGHGILTQCG